MTRNFQIPKYSTIPPDISSGGGTGNTSAPPVIPPSANSSSVTTSTVKTISRLSPIVETLLPLDAPVPRKNRILGIDISVFQNGTYDQAVTVAQNLKSEVASIAYGWTDIETSPGVYTDSSLNIANYYYPSKNMKVILSVSPIDTNVDRRPSDLQSLALNHATTIARFKTLIDYVFSKIQNVNLLSISIGNEIDKYLLTNSTKWTEWTDFYNQISAYVRTKRTGIQVGCKATQDAFLDNTLKTYLQTINQYSDVIMVTYYAINLDFTVKSPSIVKSEFDSIVTQYSKKFHFAEVGYPSSTLCNSSEQLQSDFIAEVFKAWDYYHDKITFLNFLWLHDRSTQAVSDFLNYYNYFDQHFAGFLGSLGLRYYDTYEKKCITTLRNELTKRGW